MMLTTIYENRIQSFLFLLSFSFAFPIAAQDRNPVSFKPDAGANEGHAFRNRYFEAPVRLMVGDEPLNTTAKQMYPSPAIYDVDNDGKVELIVGDIFGSLNIYENENDTGKGDPVWSRHAPLKTAAGKAIKVSNW